MRIGDLCLFCQELNNDKALVGRVIGFSYMEGRKKARVYSSTYVDMHKYVKDGDCDIGTHANWFSRRERTDTDLVYFEPLELIFTAGYLSMRNYVATIDESSIAYEPDATIAIKSASLNAILPGWEEMISLSDKFNDL